MAEVWAIGSWVLGIGIGVYAAVGLALFAFQRRLIYRPNPATLLPAQAGLSAFRVISLATPDGAKLTAWHHPAPQGAPTLLYFHGNGGHLADRRERIAAYAQTGCGVLILAYRGYSGSTGRPSEAANHRDARLAYDWLLAQGVAADRIVLYGESLGTGVAARLATHVPAAGLILDAPYTSLADVAALHYPWFPVRLFMRDRYRTRSIIGTIHCPLLILHGGRDPIVPLAMGEALLALAPEPKRIAIFPDAGHLDHYRHGSFDVARGFIAEVVQGARVPTGQPAEALS